MEYVTSERGKQKLVLEGYVYVKQKALSTGDISWECECRRHKGCKARLRVRGTDHLVSLVWFGLGVSRTNDHTHAPVTGRPEAIQVIS